MLVAAGAALVVVAGLASYVGFTNLGNTVEVLVTSAAVSRGEVVEAADLTTLQLSGGQTSPAITVDRTAEVVGQVATVDLPAGSLVTTETIAATVPVEAGSSVVGLSLTPAQLPSTPLTPGDRIRIVSTPVAQGEPPAEPPLTIEAVVFTTRQDDRTGTTIVDVVVPETIAADVAARAATGRVSIVLDSLDNGGNS